MFTANEKLTQDNNTEIIQSVYNDYTSSADATLAL